MTGTGNYQDLPSGRWEQQDTGLWELPRTVNAPPVGDSAVSSPVGAVVAYAGAVAPSGWLLCNGAAVSRTVYPALFQVLGTTYGAGDGSTTFGLPNLKGAVPAGLNAADADFDALGKAGGSKAGVAQHHHSTNIGHDHANATASGGTHQHSTLLRNNFAGGNQAGGAGIYYNEGWIQTDVSGSHTHTVDIPELGVTNVQSTDTGAANGNLQPYVVLNYIIKAV